MLLVIYMMIIKYSMLPLIFMKFPSYQMDQNNTCHRRSKFFPPACRFLYKYSRCLTLILIQALSGWMCRKRSTPEGCSRPCGGRRQPSLLSTNTRSSVYRHSMREMQRATAIPDTSEISWITVFTNVVLPVLFISANTPATEMQMKPPAVNPCKITFEIREVLFYELDKCI